MWLLLQLRGAGDRTVSFMYYLEMGFSYWVYYNTDVERKSITVRNIVFLRFFPSAPL